jgi:uncharacterized protein (TIGR02453 family)
MTFTGFPDAAITFYEGLEADNSKAFWQAHKSDYEQHVRTPMVELLDALEPEFGPAHMFRPYRDVRFSADKSPYKTYQGGFAAREEGIGLYVQISADGLLAAGGFHSHAPDQVERYRAAVDAAGTGSRLVSIVAELRAGGFEIDGDQLKTRPRGYPPDHPRLDLLRYRSLTADRLWAPEPWLHTPQALDRVRDTWRALMPLCAWVSEHVGPSVAARPARS